MGTRITVILKNGIELTYKDARVVEGNRARRIYQVNKNEQPEKLLALIDPKSYSDAACTRRVILSLSQSANLPQPELTLHFPR